MSYETFPLTPEFSLVEEARYTTLQTPYESGDIQVRAKWTKPRRFWTLQWHHATASEVEQLKGFIRDMIGASTPFWYSVTDSIPRPYAAPTMGTTAGGALGNRTLYAKFTWSDGSNETTASVEQGSLALTNGNKLTVTVPTFPQNVDRAYIYVGNITGVVHKQDTPITTSAGTWTEPGGGYDGEGDSPPSTNTLSETALVHFLDDSLEISKMSAVHYTMRLTLEELFETE